MARIRSIKPEFWTDGRIVQLPYETRLLFIGLWGFADDCGHIEDEPIRLKLQILPADDIDPADLIDQLIAVGVLERLTGCLRIKHFEKHQRVDKRAACRFDESQLLPTDPAESPRVPTDPADGMEGKGEEWKGQNQSPNGLSEKSAHSRKLSKSEEIARHWLERYKSRFATGEYSLLDYYGSALEKSWKQAVEDGADPYSTGRAVLGAFLEAALERKPNPPEWGKLGKLAKSFGIESIVGLDAALAKDLDDWYPYARATCKKRIEEQARGP